MTIERNYNQEVHNDELPSTKELLDRWRGRFQEINRPQLDALGLEVAPVFINPDNMRRIVKILLEERMGKPKKATAFGSPRLSKVLSEMLNGGYATHLKDGKNENFVLTCIPPTPYVLTPSNNGSETVIERCRKATSNHIAVRAAASEVFSMINESSWQNSIHGPLMGLVGNKSQTPEVINKHPHIKSGLSPYMRTDVVVTERGIPIVVDITPKSGGYGWWARKASLVEEFTNIGPLFNLDELGNSIEFLKETAGLRREDTVLILGGEYLNLQIDVEAINSSSPVVRIPIRSDGFDPGEESPLTFLHQLELKESENGVTVIMKDGKQIEVRGLAFWWGFEHLGGEEVVQQQGREKYFHLMRLVTSGKLIPLNHPVGMNMIESKLIPPMLTRSQSFRNSVVQTLEKYTSRTEAERMLEEAIETMPPSQLFRFYRGRIYSLDPETLVWSELKYDDSKRVLLETVTGISQNFDYGFWLAKPVSGSGARNMHVGNPQTILNQLRNNCNGVYELQPIVRSLHFRGLLDPHGLNILEEGHVPRVEVFATPNSPVTSTLVALSLTFMPGKDINNGDPRIHAGMNAFTVFVGPIK